MSLGDVLFGVIVSGVGLSAAEKTTLIQLEASSILKESPTRRAVVPKRAYRSSAMSTLDSGETYSLEARFVQ
jgi:hypothetical protein